MGLSKKAEDYGSISFIKSVSAALEGVVHTLQTQRNMRIHFLVGFLVLVAGIYFDFSYIEIIMLLFAITFVLVAEMFNTAIEYVADILAEDKVDPLIKVIKDISAGAVFVSAVNAGLTGYIFLATRVNIHTGRLLFKIKQSPWHVTLITLITAIGVVLLVKVLRKEKDLLRGGMPSGHAAIAFAIWAIISMLTLNSLVSVLVFLLALLVARSRMYTGVHKLWEVIMGGVLGALTAILVFQIMAR